MADKKGGEGFRELRDRFVDEFPYAFSNDGRPRPALARGIHHEMTTRTGLSSRVVRRFLFGWCRRPRYLASLATATHRVNLDGIPVQEVSESERQVALMQLRARGSQSSEALLRNITRYSVAQQTEIAA